MKSQSFLSLQMAIANTKLVRQSQIVQSVMYSSDAVLITQFLYNPYHSLLACIDLVRQLGILVRHNLSSVYV